MKRWPSASPSEMLRVVKPGGLHHADATGATASAGPGIGRFLRLASHACSASERAPPFVSRTHGALIPVPGQGSLAIRFLSVFSVLQVISYAGRPGDGGITKDWLAADQGA